MIEINNLIKKRIDEKFFKKIAEKVLKEEKKEKTNLSIAFVEQKRIKELNKRYRGKDKATDVLSFSNQEAKIPAPEGLGEIVICPQKVRKISFNKELSRVLIHGILHLLGYDHEKSKKEAELMEKKQELYLRKYFHG
ncbi:MAG: rRNA maturation RNase YbeY [Candidatus Nealsonbacteria bacterium]